MRIAPKRAKPKRRNTVPLRSVAARLAWSPEWLFGVERVFACLGIVHVFCGPLMLQLTWPVSIDELL